MAFPSLALPQKVEAQHVSGAVAVFGSSPAKIHLERPNTYLEKRYQDLVVQYNTLLASKQRQLPPPPGLAPPDLLVADLKLSPRKRSNSMSSADSSTKASTRERSNSVCTSPSDDGCQNGSTSIALRNIPTAFTRSAMIELLNKHGFEGEYNMVYLPMDRFRKKAKGFAFVNFEHHEGARRCMSTFEGFQDWGSLSKKVCTVEWGERQGDLHTQVLAYGNGAILRADMSEEFKPALFRNGVQVSYSASLF